MLRRKAGAVNILLDAGGSALIKNKSGWTALDEAIALRDAAIVKLLYVKVVQSTKALMKVKKAEILESMRNLQDYSLKVRQCMGHR